MGSTAKDGPRGITRRGLLRSGAALPPLLALGCSRVGAGGSDEQAEDAPPEAKRGTAIGPGSFADDELGTDRYVLAAVDLDQADPVADRIELDFLGHGVVPDPTDPWRCAVFEKRGSGACVVDLQERSVVAPIRTPPVREFYGHGAFSHDASLLYATETVVGDGSYEGVIVVRDGSTLEELGEFPSHGESPHDCVLRDEGRTLVVTNGGGGHDGGQPGSVTYVDVESQKLLDRVELPPRLNAGHLAVSEAGDLVIVSAMRDGLPRDARGGISFRSAGGSFVSAQSPAEVVRRMLGETLSVAIHEPSGIVAATNPLGHVVTFWELRTGRHVASLDLTHPRGVDVALDGSCFVVSFGRATSLLLVDAETLRPVPGTRLPGTLIGGSHVLVHDLPPRA